MKATFGTLRQLGYELISSEAVAINELIKNAIDAGASAMEITFLENEVYLTDNGSGISLDTFREIGEYISKSDKKGDTDQLGDKGLGRLATQRIGDKVKIISWDEDSVNCQKIDWSVLEKNREKDISEFNPQTDLITRENIPYISSAHSISGTSIQVSELIKFKHWGKEDVEDFIRNHYKKFFNVLDKQKKKLDLAFYYGDERLQIPELPGDLMEYEHASFNMKYISSTGKIIYKLSTKEEEIIEEEKTTNIRYADIEDYFLNKRGKLRKKNRRGELLRDSLKCDWENMNNSVLKQIGDFEVELHWFNRQRVLTEFKNRVKDSNDKASDKVKQVNEWNTIALYRNGIMVYPYGAESSDWLALDATALSRQGYKFNRQQLIGAISISKKNNNGLKDTTNRQELIHNEDYEIFITLCYYLINRYFFDAVTGYREEKKRRESKEGASELKKALNDLRGIDCYAGYPVCNILEEIAKLDPNKYPTITIYSLRTLLEACLKYEFLLPHNKEIKERWFIQQQEAKIKGKRHSPYGLPTTISEFRKHLMKNPKLKTALTGITPNNIDFLAHIAHGKQVVSPGKCEEILVEIRPVVSIIVGGTSGNDESPL